MCISTVYTSFLVAAQDPERYWWPGIEATSRACPVAIAGSPWGDLGENLRRLQAIGFQPQIPIGSVCMVSKC